MCGWTRKREEQTKKEKEEDGEIMSQDVKRMKETKRRRG